MGLLTFLSSAFGSAPPAVPPASPVVASVAPLTGLQIAAKLVEALEGFKAAPYLDTAGVWTIGIGTTHINGAPVTADTLPITLAVALQLMQDELLPANAGVRGLCGLLPVCQEAALTSFVYNEGLTAFHSSTLLTDIKAGQIQEAADQLLVWDKEHVDGVLQTSNGLHNRRVIERRLFLGDMTVLNA